MKQIYMKLELQKHLTKYITLHIKICEHTKGLSGNYIRKWVVSQECRMNSLNYRNSAQVFMFLYIVSSHAHMASWS